MPGIDYHENASFTCYNAADFVDYN